MRHFGETGELEFDRLRDVVVAEARRKAEEHCGADHRCRPETCDPPGEDRLIAFYQGISESDRELVDFLMHLHRNKFILPVDRWLEPPAK